MTMQIEGEDFENIIVPGIGNLVDFRGLSLSDINHRLDVNTFAVYAMEFAIPHGWPPEAMRQETFHSTDDGGKSETTHWYSCLDTFNWKSYYAIRNTCLNDFQMRPAYIYRRQKKPSGLAFVPLVFLAATLGGAIKLASRKHCETIDFLKGR